MKWKWKKIIHNVLIDKSWIILSNLFDDFLDSYLLRISLCIFLMIIPMIKLIVKWLVISFLSFNSTIFIFTQDSFINHRFINETQPTKHLFLSKFYLKLLSFMNKNTNSTLIKSLLASKETLESSVSFLKKSPKIDVD